MKAVSPQQFLAVVGRMSHVSWFTGEPVSAHDPDETGDWNGFMQNSARFYAIPEAQALYREAIRTVVTRTNTINGKRYVDDPTVMSWQLANEPRPGSDAEGQSNIDVFKQWVNDTAGFIRALAPKQLVSTGSEGLWDRCAATAHLSRPTTRPTWIT